MKQKIKIIVQVEGDTLSRSYNLGKFEYPQEGTLEDIIDVLRNANDPMK